MTVADGPTPRGYSSLAYDPALGDLVLFGGTAPGDKVFAETWLWNGSGWTALARPVRRVQRQRQRQPGGRHLDLRPAASPAWHHQCRFGDVHRWQRWQLQQEGTADGRAKA